MALLTARRMGVRVSQAEVLGDLSASEVLTALDVVASVLLGALVPDEGRVAQLLERLGLAAATWSLAGGGST